MRRHHPHRFMDLPISLNVSHQLYMASLRTGEEKEDWQIAEEAIDEWTRRHNPDALAIPITSGYQWKSLFLPDGTVLRTVFGGANYHCRVQGDRILYHDKPVSPSGFVNAVGGIRRNAWRCTWILFPDASVWKLADALRSRARPRPTYKPAAPSAPAPVTQGAADTRLDPGAPVADAPASARIHGSALADAADAADPTVPDATDEHALRTASVTECSATPGNNGDACLYPLLRQDLLRFLERRRRCNEQAMAALPKNSMA